MAEPRQRLFYLDLIRAAALFCILVVHFNAAVTAYFTLPHKLFASVLPLGIYLGDFGSSLFFIVSGAALMYTARSDVSAASFYRKRVKTLYPMFWVAWVLCFSIRFLTKPGFYAGAKTPSLLLTALGLDTFALSAGWVSMDFACVGEWFLGAILFLYLLFPWLQRALIRRPGVVWAVLLAICVPLHLYGWAGGLIAIHVLEFLFGMTWIRLSRKAQCAALGACTVCLALFWRVDTKITCTLVSAAVWVLLAWAAPWMDRPILRRSCEWLGKYSYPVFLVHHVIILRMAEQFDLAALTRRDTALLFGIYLLCSFAAANVLKRLTEFITNRLKGMFCGTEKEKR